MPPIESLLFKVFSKNFFLISVSRRNIYIVSCGDKSLYGFPDRERIHDTKDASEQRPAVTSTPNAFFLLLSFVLNLLKGICHEKNINPSSCRHLEHHNVCR